MSSLSRILTIARHTFKESVRDRVLYNLIVFALLLIGAAILFGSISVGIQNIIIVTLGLSAIAIFGLLMAIFIGIGLVYKEIERRTLYNILSKPVARFEFVLGKYLGLLLTLFVNTTIMTAGFFAAVYYVRRQFVISDLYLVGAIYLILLELAIVTGIALFFSSISTPMLAALLTFCLFIIGNFSSDIRWFGKETGVAALEHLTAAFYYLLPNLSDFNVITAVAHQQGIPGYLLLGASFYALLYVTVLLSATVLIFEERELR